MKNTRRVFLKNIALSGAIVAGGTTAIVASSKSKEDYDDLVRGHSPKKEILYKKSKQWKLYYEAAK